MKKKLWKSLVVGSLALFCVSMFTGCGSDKAELKDKDVLRIGVTNFADSLDPTENYFAWVVMRYGVGETLAKFDKQMVVHPWIAKSFSLSDDKMTWTIVIKDNVVFSNGRPVTAEAVKESIERVFAKSKRAKTFFTYTSMVADGQTLKITTEKPTPSLDGILADPLFLIVDVQAEKEGRNFATEGPIGTGPYVVKSFSKDKTIVTRNEKYWDGEVPFKTVEIPSIDDPTTRAMALDSGDVDMAVNIASADLPRFKDNANKFKVEEISSLRTVLARIGEKGVFKDQAVREALLMGTNKKEYADTLLHGTFIPGKAPVPPSLDYGFDQLQDKYTYNPEKAKEVLAKVGWKDTDGDGILDKDGKPLRAVFTIYNSRQELPIYAEAVQADMKKLGMDIRIKVVDYNVLDKIGINGDYDLLISNIMTANTGDPTSYLYGYWHPNVDGSNPQNGSGYNNPVVGEKLDQLKMEFDPAVRKQLIIEIQQLIMNDAASLFLGYPKTNIVASKALDGVVMYPTDYYWLTKDIKPAK